MAYTDKEKAKLKIKVVLWWQWLEESRGYRAILRRASSPSDVLLTPAFAHFIRSVWSSDADYVHLHISDAAVLAAVIARVKINNKANSFAKSLALPKDGGSKAVMSELRFMQLQKASTEEEFFTRICRAIKMLDGKVSIESLVDDILLWLREFRQGYARDPQNRLAVRWATDFYTNYKE